ncbi:hypothetical protein MLD38_032441 [Melastoma candidum]|uniref:Uncharacterized protein n=1 Tax=Melastoma candidum TaxID=119954 RepID=A0ACB9M3Q6_9MYRT|nr:hypothetical protein MLD38_032441 [Melastoma candidum]
MYHEITHVWQWNGNGQTPVGLIEWVADFVRLKGLVAELNKKMRTGYSADYFNQLLGKSADELWADDKAAFPQTEVGDSRELELAPTPQTMADGIGVEDELDLIGAGSGWVEARTWCDHLDSLDPDLFHIPPPDTHCFRCQHPSENWLCLCCKDVLCSRFVNKHMLHHSQETGHALALSFSDLSVWCFACDSYIDAQVLSQLRPPYETAYIMKFGEPPPLRTVEITDTESGDNPNPGPSSSR